jgi:hypothetical protein
LVQTKFSAVTVPSSTVPTATVPTATAPIATVPSATATIRAVCHRRFSRDALASSPAAAAPSNRCSSNGVVVRSEIQIGFVLVVCPAPQLDVVEGRFAAVAVWCHVVELEQAPLAATPSVGAREGATPAIALPHRAPHGCRDIPRAAPRRPRRARPGGGREPGLLQVRDEHRQGSVEDRSRVTGGNLMSHEILRPPQLGMHLGAGRELDLVALWRQLSDDSRFHRRRVLR